MILSLKTNPNGMRDMLGMGMVRSIHTDQAQQALASSGQLTAMQHQFFTGNVQEEVHYTNYVEERAQEVFADPNAVYPITHQENLPNASDRMKMYIVAHPEIAQKRSDGTNILPSVHTSEDTAISGRGNPIYDSVMSGAFGIGEDHEEVIYSDGYDTTVPPLTTDEQEFVRTTWSLIDKFNAYDDDELEEVFENYEYH